MPYGAPWSGPPCERRQSGPLRPSSLLPCEQPQSAGRRCGERRRAWPGARVRCATQNSVAHVSEPARLRGRRAADGGSCASLDLLHRRTQRFCASAPWPAPFVAVEDRPPRAGPWKGQSQSPAGRILLRVCRAESCGSPRERTHPPASWPSFPRASLFEPSR
jgi:hypothetical protein